MFGAELEKNVTDKELGPSTFFCGPDRPTPLLASRATTGDRIKDLDLHCIIRTTALVVCHG